MLELPEAVPYLIKRPSGRLLTLDDGVVSRYDPLMGSVATIVMGVLTFSALLGLIMMRAMILAEQAERYPHDRRRFMIRLLIWQTGIRAVGATFCVVHAIKRQPLQQIIFTLVVTLLNLGALIRMALNLKTPAVCIFNSSGFLKALSNQ